MSKLEKMPSWPTRRREIAIVALVALLARALVITIWQDLPATASSMDQESPVSPLQQPSPTGLPDSAPTVPPAPTTTAILAATAPTSMEPPIPVWALGTVMLVLALVALVVGLRRR